MLVREQEVSNRSNMGLDILSKLGIHVRYLELKV